MLDVLEKTVMMAIGVAAITQKKAEELVAEMRDTYKVSEDEGKLFVDRIQAIAVESREKVRELAEMETRKVMELIGVVPRDEFDCLVKRLQELESRQNG